MAERPKIEHAEKDGEHEFRSDRGLIKIRFDERTVGSGSASGYIGKEFLNGVLDVIERGLADRPPVDIFCDCAAVDGYDPIVRKVLTGWVRENKDRLVTVNVLATNNIVNMGVTVANLRLSGFVWTWDDAGQFGQEIKYRVVECQRGLPRSQRRPPTDRS